MNILEFMSRHPILTFFLAIIICGTITSVFRSVFGRKCKCSGGSYEGDLDE